MTVDWKSATDSKGIPRARGAPPHPIRDSDRRGLGSGHRGPGSRPAGPGHARDPDLVRDARHPADHGRGQGRLVGRVDGDVRVQLGQLRALAGRVQRLLPGHHEERARGLPGGRDEGHPRAGPAEPPRLGRSRCADGTYVDQTGAHSSEANFVFSAAVRQAAAAYLKQVAADIPLSNFYAIRLTSGGDGEMLYPGGGTYWAFDKAALTGTGLAAGMTRNPDPSWKPGTAGLSQAQIAAWVNWYVGGLDKVTNWQMQTLSGLGFNGYYETVTPGSGTRPDGLTQTEQQNLSNDGTTGVGAVWNLYYAMLPTKTNVIAYISSVADKSGGNDDCQSSDATAVPHLLDHGLLVRHPLDQRHRPPRRPRPSAARTPATASPPASTPSTPTPPPPA